MKKALAFFTGLFTCLQLFSQFPLHTVMPLGVSGVSFADTLLITRDIL
jgi:hypothetical protein